ncbi:hypothetical protein [Sphingomonas cavernae]|uniref:Lipoprotein n=1 Tax=Sphingomonas cavernae TaxID=2320861 RepID=A0A418WN33_9SPHN|nr:hypothetical protein [Sphingomonas cavernae]RJF91415.1 hypothetical protein D3876_15075 [Sphingomonas cavernae]
MKRISVALATLALLSACQKSEPSQNDAAANVSPPAANATVAPTPPGLPPADANLRFIGVWAAEPGLCQEGAWRFSERDLATAGEVSCDFDRINPVPGGYDIAAMCTAEGDETKNTLRVRFAESVHAMRLEADRVLQPVSLIYCGPAPG